MTQNRIQVKIYWINPVLKHCTTSWTTFSQLNENLMRFLSCCKLPGDSSNQNSCSYYRRSIRNSLEISTYQLWRQFIFNPFIFTDYLRSKNIIKSKVYLLVKSLRKCHQESLFKSRKAKWMKHFRREMSSQIGPLSTLHTKKLQRIFFKFILLTMFKSNS